MPSTVVGCAPDTEDSVLTTRFRHALLPGLAIAIECGGSPTASPAAQIGAKLAFSVQPSCATASQALSSTIQNMIGIPL